MNSSRENYLQVIHRFVEEKGYATNKEISQFFEISKSSVSEMIKKLKEEGYLKVERNKISLSEMGELKAEDILSARRLWEYFLSEHLGMDSEEMHRQADLLEHVASEELVERLNKYLNYPKECPCGKIIYKNK
ncbi:metal-dependent transcriptional regulator [Anaerosphaera multitolerans]|uniref:Metal-dependent transcriptional regulator n=1 Tax=Anaerosphaera multitolerans TaxID=2487351 RepID=A0A437S5F9_9FIRM|nr:metal-dependent transcriptional regulator [Anaerosphaera multitolerans]RVU54263.1 metal-dependent transcriptional regulator [Anaerosphaera multitolerans]